MTFGLPFLHWECGAWMHKFVGLLDCNCNPNVILSLYTGPQYYYNPLFYYVHFIHANSG